MKANNLTILLFFLFGLLCQSCNKGNEAEPNHPPSAFTVTTKLMANGSDVLLSWTKAKDPDNDPVNYAVVFKDTLAKKLTDTTYIIKSIAYNTTQTGSVIASDYEKSTSASFTVTTGLSPYVSIQDLNFELALISIGIDDVQDGKILLPAVQKITSLNLSGRKIANLQGIEFFTKLTSLNCSNGCDLSVDLSS